MKLLSTVLAWVLPIFAMAATLAPRTPSVITNNGLVFISVYVAGTGTGYMAVWTDTNSNVQSSFTNSQGFSWSEPFQIGSSASFIPQITANAAGFAAAWQVNTPGYPPGGTVTAFYSIADHAWSAPAQISPASADPGGAVYNPTIGATGSGFMSVWWDYNIKTNWFSFSADGTHWSQAAEIPASTSYVAASVCGSGTGFIAVWDNNNKRYASYTSDNGGHWSVPVQVASNVLSFFYSPIPVAGSQAGFMTSWHDASNNLYVSFSNDQGATWGSPVLVAAHVDLSSEAALSASSKGFVLAWLDNANTPLASMSTDNGLTWSTPIILPLHTPGKFSVGLGVAATEKGCMFTSYTMDRNAESSFAPFPVGLVNPKGMNHPVKPFNPKAGL